MFSRDKFRLFYQSEYKKGNLKEVQRSVEKVILFCTRACLKIEKVLDFCAGRGGFKKKTAERVAACRGFSTPKSARFGQKDSIGDFSNRP